MRSERSFERQGRRVSDPRPTRESLQRGQEGEEEKETTANRIEGRDKEGKRGKQLFNVGGRSQAVKLT